MDAAFAAHPALFHGAVIDVLAGGFVEVRIGLGAQEQPGTIMTRTVGALGTPTVFEFLKQARTQGQDPFLGALAVADVQLHAGPINVGGLEVDGFGQAQPGGIDGHEEGAVARLSGGGQERFQLALGIDLGPPGVALHARDGGQQIRDVAPEGDGVEEAHGIDGEVHAGRGQVALADEVMDPIDDLVVGDAVGRPGVVTCQVGDVTGVGLLSTWGQTADGHVPLIFCS